jgi:hypothetical protein
LNDNTIFIGFDIGGVTSDILLLVNDMTNQRARLAKQSSVKVAADRISNAVSLSSDIQRVLRHFCQKFKQGIGAMDTINSNSSHFLLNILFDKMERDPRLEQQLYSQFWAPEIEEINRSQTRGVMAVAAYVTGMLMYHAGQMARSYILEETQRTGEKNRKYNIRAAYFGKGGKLFQWIPKAISDASGMKYYEDCFMSGLSADFANNNVASFVLETKQEYLKLEVAYGLSAPRSIIVDDVSETEIVGEEGYMFDGKPLNWNDRIRPEHIFEFGERMSLPVITDEDRVYDEKGAFTAYPNFNQFLDLFFHLIKDWDLFDYTVLQHQRIKFAAKSLENYVKSDEDWLASSSLLKRSQIPSDFKFSCSPFLYQGACFLDEVFIKKIFMSQENV